MNPSILERKERWAKKMAGQSSRVLKRSSERLPPGQHLTSGFPVLDLGIQPDVSLAEWSLELSGEVEEPIKVFLEELSRLPRFEDVRIFIVSPPGQNLTADGAGSHSLRWSIS